MSDSHSLSTTKKFAVGYFFSGTVPFVELVRRYSATISEVFFPWPGILTARRLPGDNEKLKEKLKQDLAWCRSEGFALDLLLNATCYGDDSATAGQKKQILTTMNELDSIGLLPEIVTTTSPFIAKVIKEAFPGTDLRASVNMRLNSTLAMEYVSEYFDSFYICRDIQRDVDTLKIFSSWCKSHGKKLGLLANSGCLRSCPWQTFHETLLSHGFNKAARECATINLPVVFCAKAYKDKRIEEFLRASWIRPEDLHIYEPFVSVIKLSTREAAYPELILKAYNSRKFTGDLFDIIDPGFVPLRSSFIMENSAFPENWAQSKIAGLCAINCTHCGKCEEVLKKVTRYNARPQTTENISIRNTFFR